MNIEQCKELFVLCKEFGVRSFKYEDYTTRDCLEATFEPVELSGISGQLGGLPGFPANGKVPTDDEFLFAATEGFEPKEAIKEEG